MSQEELVHRWAVEVLETQRTFRENGEESLLGDAVLAYVKTQGIAIVPAEVMAWTLREVERALGRKPTKDDFDVPAINSTLRQLADAGPAPAPV